MAITCQMLLHDGWHRWYNTSCLLWLKKNLTNVLRTLEDDPQNEVKIFADSPYLSMDELDQTLSKYKNKFSIMSLNIQSISIKFDSLFALLSILDERIFYLNAICLQETWLSGSQDLSPYAIPGYQLINCPRSCSIHIGLIIYLREELSYDIKLIQRDSDLWEGLFIDIQGGNLHGKLTIGSIYRPPRNNNSNACVEKFLNELSPIIANICRNNYNTVITGDMNLDLLKIDEREKFQAYFDLFVTHSFFPHIMYPTRISKVQSHRSARSTRKHHTRMSTTLIDQMFCQLKDII